MPIIIRKSQPEYTQEARQARIEGTVLLYTIIDESGKPTHVKVVRSLDAGLDQMAIECVEKWQFTPSLALNGTPRTKEVTIEVNFRQ